MDNHNAHVLAFSGYMLTKMLGGKTIYEHKQDHIKQQRALEAAWAKEYPQKGERVIFRSVDKAGAICDGYGYVQHVHVHDFRTGYALYTVKLEDVWNDEKDTYQLYANRPGQEDKEWIKRV